jgi:hypothetical protein
MKKKSSRVLPERLLTKLPAGATITLSHHTICAFMVFRIDPFPRLRKRVREFS